MRSSTKKIFSLSCMVVLAALPSASGADDFDALLKELDSEESNSSATSGPDRSESNLQVAPETLPVSVARPEPVVTEPPRERPKGLRLEEIVVTAQRKVSTIQDTPMSIEAFGAEKLELRGIGGLEDLGANVPSMVVEPHPLSNTTLRITIRGVGVTDSQVTQDPAVGIYIDGVYLARSVGLALDLADIERMEVLRGPQGVLYGRNSTGGAVNIITKRPEPGVFEMSHKFTIGQREMMVGKSSINVPVTDDVAVKLALIGRRSGGFVENTAEGEDFGDRRALGLRFDARWLATDDLTVDYGYDFSDLEYVNYLFQGVLLPESNQGLAEYFKPFAVANSVYSSRRLERLGSGAPMEASSAKVFGHTLTLARQFENFEIKYVGATRDLEDSQYPDLAGGGGATGYRIDLNAYDSAAARMVNGGEPTPLVIPKTFQTQWSHEVQISGDFMDDRLSYIAGLYYFTENGGEDGGPIHHIQSAIIDPQQTDVFFGLLPDDVRSQVRDLINPGLSAYWDYVYGIENKAYAAFGQISFRPLWLEERLNFTLGVRASKDERYAIKNFIQRQFVEGRAPGGLSVAAVSIPGEAIGASDDFNNVEAFTEYDDFSPSANVQYEITNEAKAYFSYSTAYKSGGFNLRDPQVSADSGPASDGKDYGFGFVEGFRPERVTSYELGLKSEWLQGGLRLNAAAFYSDYTDMQTNFQIPGTISDTKALNAGKARLSGLEMDGAFIPARNLILGFQYGYLDARVLEIINIDGENEAHLYPFIAAPPHSGVLFVDWAVASFSWGDMRAYFNWNYLGDREGFVITEDRRGKTAIDGYGLFNARLMLNEIRVGNGTLDIAIWGKNLLDEEYELTAIAPLPQTDRGVIWGEPRLLGLDLSFRF